MRAPTGLDESLREKLLAELAESQAPLSHIEREIRWSCGPRSSPAKAARKVVRSLRVLERELRSVPEREQDAQQHPTAVRQGGRIVDLELLRQSRLERLRKRD